MMRGFKLVTDVLQAAVARSQRCHRQHHLSYRNLHTNSPAAAVVINPVCLSNKESPTLASNELVVKKRAQQEHVFHLGFGQSPFPVPKILKRELAMHAGNQKYAPTVGFAVLRDAVLTYYEDRLNLPREEYDVIVAPGSKLLLFALQLAVEGDLLMPVPSWVSYPVQAKLLGTDVVKVPTMCEDYYFAVDPEILRQTVLDARKAGKNPTKIILNSPSNPMGLSCEPSNLAEIAKVCDDLGVLVISDEIYGFVQHYHPKDYKTVASTYPHNTVITTGLSKHLSLGGWRIGVSLVPKAIPGLYDALRQIASETWSAVPSPIQMASVAAYQGSEEIEAHISNCSLIHSIVCRWFCSQLVDAGISCHKPSGGFYVYPSFRIFSSELNAAGITGCNKLAEVLLEKYNIATLPGTAFGAEDGEYTLRLALCDYDGKKALANLKQYDVDTPDEVVVKALAPNIFEVISVFKTFLKDNTTTS